MFHGSLKASTGSSGLRCWHKWLVVCGILWFSAPAVAHELGHSSLAVLVEPTRINGELVLDVPKEVLETQASERRRSLLSRVSNGLAIATQDGKLSLEFTVLSLGSGANAVDVMRVRAPLKRQPNTLKVETSLALGTIAVSVSGDDMPTERAVANAEVPAVLKLRWGVEPVKPSPSETSSTENSLSTSSAVPSQEKSLAPKVRGSRNDHSSLIFALLLGAVVAGVCAGPLLGGRALRERLLVGGLVLGLSVLVWWFIG